MTARPTCKTCPYWVPSFPRKFHKDTAETEFADGLCQLDPPGVPMRANDACSHHIDMPAWIAATRQPPRDPGTPPDLA